MTQRHSDCQFPNRRIMEVSKRIWATLLVVLLMGTVVAAQSERGPANKSLGLSRGARIYIAAFHRIHDTGGARGTVSNAGYVFRHDLGYEGQINKEFEKLKVFNVVSKLSEAEFVFLIYIDGSAAEGFAVSPAKYNEYKEQANLDGLREAATWRGLVGPLKIPTRGRLTSQLVKKFHEASS